MKIDAVGRIGYILSFVLLGLLVPTVIAGIIYAAFNTDVSGAILGSSAVIFISWATLSIVFLEMFRKGDGTQWKIVSGVFMILCIPLGVGLGVLILCSRADAQMLQITDKQGVMVRKSVVPNSTAEFAVNELVLKQKMYKDLKKELERAKEFNPDDKASQEKIKKVIASVRHDIEKLSKFIEK